ncbi:MAG: 3D domain-containing protein [Candidatus Bruticola sp.]
MRKLWAYVLVACVWTVPVLLLAQSAFSQDLGLPPAPSLVSVSPNESSLLSAEVIAETVEVDNTRDIEDITVKENKADKGRENSNHLKIADSLAASFIHGAQTSAKYKVNEPEPQGKTFTVTAYAYCLNGRTASGHYTGPGCIAVDPSVIPIGSKIYVPGYGWGEARDTGGGIYGNKIDIWLPSSAQCSQWGVRTVTVTVLK